MLKEDFTNRPHMEAKQEIHIPELTEQVSSYMLILSSGIKHVLHMFGYEQHELKNLLDLSLDAQRGTHLCRDQTAHIHGKTADGSMALSHAWSHF